MKPRKLMCLDSDPNVCVKLGQTWDLNDGRTVTVVSLPDNGRAGPIVCYDHETRQLVDLGEHPFRFSDAKPLTKRDANVDKCETLREVVRKLLIDIIRNELK